VSLDDENLLVRMFGTCQDITDSRRAQEETFARQKLESVGVLASGIAHDFNNLLGGVLAQADLALDELAAGASPEEELKGIREGAIRGSEIVRQLMVYGGKESEVPELVDVSRIVEDMLDLLRISMSKRAALETDLGKGLPNVRANSAQFRQIVMNLVTNASEAIGDHDGVIGVKTRCVTVGRDSAGMTWEHWATGDYLRLEVSDTGCGIPLETQARVFDPFFTTKSAGRGLGLAVVHGIVEGLGGMIRLESEPGRGTKFQILLPCAETAAVAANCQVARTEEKPRLSYGTVLVVEDEEPLRRPVAKMLQKTGFTVIEASDGYAALQAIRSPQKNIDILLLDVTLPGAPSRDVFAQAQLLRPGMKVIITSAYSREMATASLAGTVEHFIRKPYRLDELRDLVQQSRG
jgi:nitrogen-specific signal transduction histidine kinase/CheY-like chemotaxis protein